MLWLSAALLAVVVVAMLSAWWLLDRQRVEEHWVTHTGEVLRHVDAVLSDVVDCETAERGFVISGERSFLEPYQAARLRLAYDLDKLRSLTRDNPPQQRRLAQTERVARAELAAFGRVIALRDSDLRAALAAIAAGGDKALTDEIRRVLGDMKREELALLKRRQDAARQTSGRTVLFIFSLHGAVLIALALGAWMVQRSVARRELAEREKERLEATLQLAQERQVRDDFREQFLAIVGHDLRTPLGAIAIEAQLLDDQSDADERKQTGRRILDSTRRMTRMVEQLVDATRSRLGGGMPITLREVDLTQVIDRVIGELAHGGRIAFTHPAAPLLGRFDADRIAQVVSNLVGNALAHGQGEVRVSLRAVHEQVELTVHNHGEPIAPDVLGHLFEPFRRGRGDSSGLGLGLFISDQIVRGHGGSIEVRSGAEGTDFTVRVPAG